MAKKRRKPEDIEGWARAIAPWTALGVSVILLLGGKDVPSGKLALVTMLFTGGIVAAVADRNRRKEDPKHELGMDDSDRSDGTVARPRLREGEDRSMADDSDPDGHHLPRLRGDRHRLRPC